MTDLIAKLEARVSELKAQVDQAGIARRENEALDKISGAIRHYTEILGVENYELTTRIDPRNLTLVINSPAGRRDYLWEIGSGANYMGYHIATLLALHEHFLEMSDASSTPVPQFLFIDQPSQAFFPERWSIDRSKREPEMAQDDVVRVRRIFLALSEAVRRTKKRLQIILIDHVGESVWNGIPHIRLTERWRGGDALIPQDW